MEQSIIDYAIIKLTELQIRTHEEDMKRGKKRYVSKESAFRDLVKLLKEMNRYEIN
ncbi:MAG: hypothetical protein IJH55_10305 [Romboutsia sp.]|nr:hypothetical protein [Romboutsia sp.]